MVERFVLLRSTPTGPVFLAWREAPGYVEAWTGGRTDARRFTDRADADAVRAEIVARDGVAVAVVPET